MRTKIVYHDHNFTHFDMKTLKTLFICSLIVLTVFSCKKEDEYEATEIHTIPYGESGTLKSGDYSGDGTATNAAGTTVTIEGDVVVDAFSASGSVYIPEGTSLTCNSTFNLGGGAVLDIKGTLITPTYTQVGNTYVSNGKMSISGKFTIGGGTTLYLENSEVEVGELVIIGHVNAIENDETEDQNYYSVFEFTGAKYLNRGGGTKICGPVLFTVDSDQGASGASMNDVTSTALQNNSSLISTYGLDANSTFFEYSDYCAGLSEMPAH